MNMAASAFGDAVRAAGKSLSSDPAGAERQARQLLEAAPGDADATLILAAAMRRQGRAQDARDLLRPLARSGSARADIFQELGLAEAALGTAPQHVIPILREAVARNPRLTMVWRALAEQHLLAGEGEAADAAQAESIRASVSDPELMAAADALVQGKLAIAEPILRARLKRAPGDVAAIRMLAEIAARLGRLGDAEKLLARALELAPGFNAARHNYALILHRQNRPQEAIVQIDRLLADDPHNAGLANLKAAALGRIGEYDDAIALYEDVLARIPDQPKVWMSYGHALKTVGRQQDSVGAYRRSIALMPHLGEAWWSLANLKRVRFTDADRAAMRQALAGDIEEEDRFHLEFALGKAEEDAGNYETAFRHYVEGNARRRQMVTYDADEVSAHVARSRALLTSDFFAGREGQGCPAPDPIFILGMPRAGSTLIEQILSSHSSIEGTMELPDIPAIVQRLGARKLRSQGSAYPDALADLDAATLRDLGAEYLERTRIQRKTGRPLFIDKMPNNFLHVGLIHLILPNAKIIDARRHPMGCCLSNFKQHFARGQTFAYDLEEMGRYYRDYVELMAHFDAVLPGRVHRVHYEAMVADTEGEVRRLLDYLGLEFEPACLRHHETERAVRTASSEQVREPIFRDGVDQWRHFAAWLSPLEAVLAPALAGYPAAYR